MKDRSRFVSSIGFLDLIFNVLLGFVALVIILLIITKIEQSDPSPPNRNEMIFTLTWDDQSHDDIDIWIMDPKGTKVGWLNKDSGTITLQRDDTGVNSDVVVNPDGSTSIVKLNQEVQDVRQLIPGNYVVNTFMFYKRDKTPTKVTAKMIKIRPYREYPPVEVVLESNGQEETLFNFEVDQNGNITNLSRLPIKYVGGVVSSRGLTPGGGGFGGWEGGP